MLAMTKGPRETTVCWARIAVIASSALVAGTKVVSPTPLSKPWLSLTPTAVGVNREMKLILGKVFFVVPVVQDLHRHKVRGPVLGAVNGTRTNIVIGIGIIPELPIGWLS